MGFKPICAVLIGGRRREVERTCSCAGQISWCGDQEQPGRPGWTGRWPWCTNCQRQGTPTKPTRSPLTAKERAAEPLTLDVHHRQDNLRPGAKRRLFLRREFQYSVSRRILGKDWQVVALDNMFGRQAAYYEGKQIALHRISYQRKDMVVNPQHYRRLKQTMDAENIFC